MKILLIVNDGMRPDCIEGHRLTKCLKENGSYCMDGRTVMPSVTLPCHMSLFHSVDPSRHGIVTNTYMPQVRPIDGLFEVLEHSDKKCAILYNWEPIRDVARPGSIARSEFIHNRFYGLEDTNKYLCERAKEWLKDGDIDFAFLYLGWVDGAGHDFGWCSEGYMYALNTTCDLVYDLVRELGDKYTIIFTADHGGHERTHGTDLDEDMTIPVFFLGEPFEKVKKLEGVSIKDIAPTIASLMGAKIPMEWEGKVVG